MNKLLLIALLAFGGWRYHQDYVASDPVTIPNPFELLEPAYGTPSLEEVTSPFVCDGRQYCEQMSSRAEADYFHGHCPEVMMDGDGDGVPCEDDLRF